MSEVTIKSNHIPRPVLRWHDLTENERAEFDYLDTDEKREFAQFGRYKGWVYDLTDMNRQGSIEIPKAFRGWSDYLSDSYFSGIVIRYTDDFESVIFGTWFC